MGTSATLTVQIDTAVKDRLHRLAQIHERSLDEEAGRAIMDHLELHDAQVRGIDRAIEEADRGELIGHEEVVAWAGSMLPSRSAAAD